MKSMLYKLYHGKINPFERIDTYNEEYKNLIENYLKAEKQLKKAKIPSSRKSAAVSR